MADAAWTRQTESPRTYLTLNQDPAKGVMPVVVQVTYAIISEDPFLVVYYNPSAVEYHHDSHGSLDKLRSYAPKDPMTGEPVTWNYRGHVVSWITSVGCGGAQREHWLVVPGVEGGCTNQQAIASYIKEWTRQTYDPNQFKNVNNDPARGVDYPMVILSYEQEIGLNGEVINTDKPICNPFHEKAAAKGSLFWNDSHGQLDHIQGMLEGPSTSIVQSVMISREPCPSPKQGMKWTISGEGLIITLHPGSVLLATESLPFNCCNCCYLCTPPAGPGGYDCGASAVLISCCAGPDITLLATACVPKVLKVCLSFNAQTDEHCIQECVSSPPVCGQLFYIGELIEIVEGAPEGVHIWSGQINAGGCLVTIVARCKADETYCLDFALKCGACHQTPEGRGWFISIGCAQCSGPCIFNFLDQVNEATDCCCPLFLYMTKSVIEWCCGNGDTCDPPTFPGCCGIILEISEP